MIDVCMPVYDKVESQTLVSLMSANWPAKRRLVVCEGEPDISMARNKLVQTVMDGMHEFSLWVDADIVFPANAIFEMLRVMGSSEDIGVVTGLYRGRTWPHHATVYVRQDREAFVNGFMGGRLEPYEVDACGAGFMMVRNSMFTGKCRATFDKHGTWSEDLSFCTMVRQTGMSIMVIPSIRCGHVSKSILTMEGL